MNPHYPDALTGLRPTGKPGGKVFTFLVLLLLPVFGLRPSVFAEAPKDAVVIVGSEIDKSFDLEQAYRRLVPAGAFHTDLTPDKKARYRDEAVELLVNRSLLYLGAVDEGYAADPEKVKNILKQNIQQYGSRENLASALRRVGLSVDEFLHRVEKEMLVEKYSARKLDEASRVSDDALRKHYEENRDRYRRPVTMELWHIVLRVEPNAPWDERMGQMKQAMKVAEEAKQGKDFALLAEKYSEDEYRYVGGHLGRVHQGQLDPAIEKAAFELEEGAVAGPVETIYGYHILKAGSRSEAGFVSFEEIRPKLKTDLEAKKYEALKTELLAELRQGVDIRIPVDEK